MRSLNVKKKLVTLGLVVVMAMGQCMSAFANYSDISMWVWTGTIDGEKLRPGWNSKSDTYYITSMIFTDCLGKNTKVRLLKSVSLPSNFLSDSNRILTLELWEDDVNNDDDLVSTYKGTFKGRKLATFSLSKRNITGLIDSEGDDRAEFYTLSRITRSVTPTDTHEYSKIFTNSFFRYEIGMQ